jgi:hypothetical protein
MNFRLFVIYIFLCFSLNLLGQTRFNFGVDAGLTMCFTQYKLRTDIDEKYQDIYSEGSFYDPNYLIGLKGKMSVNEKQSVFTGITYIHKNYGIEYFNELDNKKIDFSYYGAFYNFEIPLIYEHLISEFYRPKCKLSGKFGGAYQFYKYDFASFFNDNSDFNIVQIKLTEKDNFKSNLAIKAGLVLSSYNSKIGQYEFGLNYSLDLFVSHQETLDINDNQNYLHADFDVRIPYLSLYFGIYPFDFNLFQGRIYKD